MVTYTYIIFTLSHNYRSIRQNFKYMYLNARVWFLYLSLKLVAAHFLQPGFQEPSLVNKRATYSSDGEQFLVGVVRLCWLEGSSDLCKGYS